MDYLNRLDKKVKNLDVVDDFRNEKAEVRKARGLNYSFSYGDYVKLKTLSLLSEFKFYSI